VQLQLCCDITLHGVTSLHICSCTAQVPQNLQHHGKATERLLT
jgi:hypothetical protein